MLINFHSPITRYNSRRFCSRNANHDSGYEDKTLTPSVEYLKIMEIYYRKSVDNSIFAFALFQNYVFPSDLVRSKIRN